MRTKQARKATSRKKTARKSTPAKATAKASARKSPRKLTAKASTSSRRKVAASPRSKAFFPSLAIPSIRPRAARSLKIKSAFPVREGTFFF